MPGEGGSAPIEMLIKDEEEGERSSQTSGYI
jgi:hypothetical protein